MRRYKCAWAEFCVKKDHRIEMIRTAGFGYIRRHKLQHLLREWDFTVVRHCQL